MTIIAAIYAFLFLMPAAVVALYYFGLMVARLAGASAVWPASEECVNRFAIIIPAHNEEGVIAETIKSCLSIDYDNDKLDIYVLADNCSDRTSEIARRYGVQCLERQDTDNPGKGQVLQWAFPQILSSSCDAIVVIDADCVVDSHALHVFDRCLVEGHRVLQANYVMSNPDACSISYVARIGNVTEYDLFYAPKSDLGLAVTLVGTGMVFHRSILENHPWQALSVTEDVEYTLALIEARIPVRFVSNVGVHQAAAERLDQLQPQRERWASGTLGLGRRQALSLVFRGVLHGNYRLVDFGWTLAIISRPLVLTHLFFTVVIGGLIALPTRVPLYDALFGMSIAILALQIVYFGVGVGMVGVSWHRLTLLLATPRVGLRLIAISVGAVLSTHERKWQRTPR